MIKRLLILIIFLLNTLFNYELISQSIPIVKTLNNPSPGYFFLEVNEQTPFQLYDNYGNYIFEKETKSQKRKKILENGLIAEFAFNKYLIYNQNIELIDSIVNPTSYTIDMHDFVALRNGNYMMLLDKSIQVDLSDIVDGGKSDASIVDNILIETDGKGNIYWIWSAFDHLQLTDATSSVDLTMNVIDPFHINSIFEDSNGNLLISIRHFDEIALINKQTKQFIWRFGGQNCKNNQYTILNDEIDGFIGFSHQHTASILPNGNILMFDNGNLKPQQYSRAVEYSINHQSKTATKVWEFRNTPDIYTFVMGSAYRLENGNTLICWGWSKNAFTEVRPDKTITIETEWDKVSAIYRVQKSNLRQAYNSIYINSVDLYDYNSTSNETGVAIKVESINGSGGKTHVQKHFYPPNNSTFADNQFYAILPYRWVFSNDGGFSSISGEFGLDLSKIDNLNFPQGVAIYQRQGENNGEFRKLEANYNFTNKSIIAKFEGFGEFVLVKTKIKGPNLLIPQNNSRALTTYGELKWEDITNSQKYIVQLSSNDDFSIKIIDSVILNKESLQYKGLQYNREYFWRVKAISGNDSTDWSETFSFRTNIASPSILNPQYNFVGFKTDGTFAWNSVDVAESYQFQLSDEKSFQNLIINSKNLKTTSIKAIGLEYNTIYYCRVRAIASPDTSNWSSYVVFTTTLPPPKPILPTKNSADIEIPVKFVWGKVIGSSDYNIEISEDNLFENDFLIKLITADTSIFINTLKSGMQYYWRVRALRTADTSYWSEIFSVKTKANDADTTELPIPIVFYPRNNEFAVQVDGLVRWSKVDKASSYKIRLAKEDGELVQEFNTKGANTFEIYFDKLNYNTKYIVQIKAINANSESKWSEPIVFTTELKTPIILSPRDKSIDVPEKGRFEILTDYSQFNFYLQVALDSNFQYLIIDKIGVLEEVSEYSLNNETTYFSRLMQIKDSNRSRWSDKIVFTTRKLNSIQQIEDNEIFIYRNYKNQSIVIRINNIKKLDNVAIYSLTGNKVLESKIIENLVEIDVNSINKGIYLVLINSKCNQVLKSRILYFY